MLCQWRAPLVLGQRPTPDHRWGRGGTTETFFAGTTPAAHEGRGCNPKVGRTSSSYTNVLEQVFFQQVSSKSSKIETKNVSRARKTTIGSKFEGTRTWPIHDSAPLNEDVCTSQRFDPFLNSTTRKPHRGHIRWISVSYDVILKSWFSRMERVYIGQSRVEPLFGSCSLTFLGNDLFLIERKKIKDQKYIFVFWKAAAQKELFRRARPFLKDLPPLVGRNACSTWEFYCRPDTFLHFGPDWITAPFNAKLWTFEHVPMSLWMLNIHWTATFWRTANRLAFAYKLTTDECSSNSQKFLYFTNWAQPHVTFVTR